MVVAVVAWGTIRFRFDGRAVLASPLNFYTVAAAATIGPGLLSDLRTRLVLCLD